MIPATLCYVKKDGKTLFLNRNKKENDMHEGKYVGLGGKFDPGESPEDCIIREVEEESGLKITAPRLRGILTVPPFGKREAFSKTWQIYVFTASEYEGELIDSNEGTLEWIEDDKISTLPLWESDKIWLPWLEKDGLFSVKFKYDDDEKLVDHKVAFHR